MLLHPSPFLQNGPGSLCILLWRFEPCALIQLRQSSRSRQPGAVCPFSVCPEAERCQGRLGCDLSVLKTAAGENRGPEQGWGRTGTSRRAPRAGRAPRVGNTGLGGALTAQDGGCPGPPSRAGRARARARPRARGWAGGAAGPRHCAAPAAAMADMEELFGSDADSEAEQKGARRWPRPALPLPLAPPGRPGRRFPARAWPLPAGRGAGRRCRSGAVKPGA